MQVKFHWYSVQYKKEFLLFEIPQLVGIAAVLLLSFMLSADPRLFGTHEQLGLPPCPSREMLGVSCPSCGMTTSFTLLSHGRVGSAFQANYFGPALYAIMLAYGALLLSFVVRRKRIRYEGPSRLPLLVALGVLALYILTWGVRVLQEI